MYRRIVEVERKFPHFWIHCCDVCFHCLAVYEVVVSLLEAS